MKSNTIRRTVAGIIAASIICSLSFFTACCPGRRCTRDTAAKSPEDTSLPKPSGNEPSEQPGNPLSNEPTPGTPQGGTAPGGGM